MTDNDLPPTDSGDTISGLLIFTILLVALWSVWNLF